MKRALAIAAAVELLFALALFHTEFGKFMSVHPWWRSGMAALPGFATAVFAYFEWQDSAKVTELREENNRLQSEANSLRQEANTERSRANEALARIAENTVRSSTRAERNAARLGPYLRRRVFVVNSDDSSWPEPPEIVEIENEVVTLFTPTGPNSSTAIENHVHCDDLEITEGAVGSLPVTLKILKRFGAARHLGEIRTWEERVFVPTTAGFPKGSNVFHAQYTKPGSPEVRRLAIFEAADGSNYFLLEPSVGASLRGNNQEISRKFLQVQLEYQIEGFRWNGGGTGSTRYQLYLSTQN